MKRRHIPAATHAAERRLQSADLKGAPMPFSTRVLRRLAARKARPLTLRNEEGDK